MFGLTRKVCGVVAALAMVAGAASAQDFDRDGYADLVYGVPTEDVGGQADCGAVIVIYSGGATLGLDGLGAVMITQQSSGVDINEAGDRFGASVAWGDFDFDSYQDLAIGVPGEDIGAAIDCGAVAILYGSPLGLVPMGNSFVTQSEMYRGDPEETGDGFGSALAVGDFNADNYHDLAVGTPSEDEFGLVDCGVVQVEHGSANGLFQGTFVLIGAIYPSLIGTDESEAGDMFGGTLVSGDFDGVEGEDLAIASEFEDIGAAVDCGAVTVMYGFGDNGFGFSPGLQNGNAQFWHQNTPLIEDSNESGDRFGAALATGDFDMNGSDDLVIGVPGEGLGVTAATGRVAVIYGVHGLKGGGLYAATPLPDQTWHQNTAGVPLANAAGDNFGAALTVGWLGGPFDISYHYLAIGIPGKDLGTNPDAGSVITMYTGHQGIGLSAVAAITAPEAWNQNTAGIGGGNTAGDRFGSVLGVGDFDRNWHQDLVIGTPLDNVGTVADCGAINVIYSRAALGFLDALGPVASEYWHQNISGIPDSNEAGDGQGAAVTGPVPGR